MIRIASERDLPRMLEIYAPYVRQTTVSFEYEAPTREEFLLRFRSITHRFPWLVWEERGCILGYAYASAPFERAAYSWCAEPSIYLHPEAQGSGIGKKLYLALEELLKLQGFTVLYALITGENTRSLRFHEKLGYRICTEFSRCGYKLGHWCSLVWMEKPLQIVENPMDFPTKWSAIRQDDQKICDILYNLSLS